MIYVTIDAFFKYKLIVSFMMLLLKVNLHYSFNATNLFNLFTYTEENIFNEKLCFFKFRFSSLSFHHFNTPKSVRPFRLQWSVL